VVLLVLVNAAFSAVWAFPHLMFRTAAAAARPSPEALAGFWNRKMSVDASDEGVVVTLGSRATTIRWGDCGRLSSDARSHVLFHGDSGFLIVPRRVFRSPEKDAAFQALASRFIAANGASARDASDVP